MKQPAANNQYRSTSGLCIGIALGAALGFQLNNIGTGIAIGAGAELLFDMLYDAKKKKE